MGALQTQPGGALTLFNQTIVVAAGVPAAFPDLVIPLGGNLTFTIANQDAANSCTVSVEKFPLGANVSGLNDGFVDAAASAAFGTMAHGAVSGLEQTGCAFQTLRVTITSASGLSGCRMQAAVVRQQG
jgi:hypothetical protein